MCVGRRNDLVKSSYLGSVTSSPTKQLSTAFNAREETNTGRGGGGEGEAGGERGRRTMRRM